MKLTRKAFIARAAVGTIAAVATTIAGSSAADAGPSPHMRPVDIKTTCADIGATADELLARLR